jgi:ubiquinone/menaquinone biosynthesis C-methylase UbiE
MTGATRQDSQLLNRDSAALAQDYERISAEWQFRSGQRLVEALAIAPGERVLDLGCGTGLLTRHIADRVGSSGYVLGLDPLPLRIELAAARAAANLEFRVGNAYALDFIRDSTFDVACMNAVLHWLPEKSGPLRQLARILKPGGRFGSSSGLPGGSSPAYDVVADVLSQPPFRDHPRAKDDVSYRIDAPEFRDLLTAAGFTVVRIDIQDMVQQFDSPEAAIRFFEASSFGNFLGHLPEPLRAPARAAIKRGLEALVPSGAVRRDGRRMVAIAEKR